MSFLRQVGLHPELVDDVIEELLESNLISLKNVDMLKNEEILITNPSVIMDARHAQVNRKCSTTSNILSNRHKQKQASTSKEHLIRLQMLEVENEIQQFRKEVDYEREKLHLIAKLTKISKSKILKEQEKDINLPPAMPVTNVITQLKACIQEESMTIKNYPEIDTDEVVNIDLLTVDSSSIIFESAPLEVLSYKNVNEHQHECPNNGSSFCPHKKKVRGLNMEDKNENSYQVSDVNKIVGVNNDDGEMKGKKNVEAESTEKGIVESESVNEYDCGESPFFGNTKRELQTVEKITENEKEIVEFQETKRVRFLLRKYWNSWVDFTKESSKMARIKAPSLSKSEKCLQRFLVKLEERKKVISKTLSLEERSEERSSSSDRSRENCSIHTEVFANRLQAQKSIIKEQKSKIEMQNKLIEQLKFEKIQQEIKTSESNLRLNVLETLKNCEEKTKPAVKSLRTVIGDFHYKENEQKITKFDFVTRMNERAEQRKERWNVIREKRKQQEDEAERERMEVEERRKNEEEEKRRKLLQEKKERAELKKEAERKKQLEVVEYNRKCIMAEDFYSLKLMNKVLNALRKNVSMMQDRLIEASEYCNSRMLGKCFNAWKNHSFFSLMHKLLLAETFCQYNLLQKCWHQWMMCHKESIKNRQVADDFCDSKIQEKFFRKWKKFRKEEQILYREKKDVACDFYNRKLLKKCLDSWRGFPKLMFKEREKEQRIRQWHDKVQEILPDFSPISLDDS